MTERFTPTQKRILSVLSDGQPHTKAELLDAIAEGATMNTFSVHLAAIREILRPSGQDVIPQYTGKRGANHNCLYRWVVLLPQR